MQRDHETGKAKGFAFIEFYSHDAAAEVLAQYKGRDIPGARLPHASLSNANGLLRHHAAWDTILCPTHPCLCGSAVRLLGAGRVAVTLSAKDVPR